MKTIHKFRIESGKEPTALTLREGYRVVRCEYIIPEKSVFLWVEQSLSISTPTLERRFRVALSGEPVPDNFGYVGTALEPFSAEAYHLFEMPVAAGVDAPVSIERAAAMRLNRDAAQQHAAFS